MKWVFSTWRKRAEGISPPVSVNQLAQNRGANAPRSLSHLPARLRHVENTHFIFTHIY